VYRWVEHTGELELEIEAPTEEAVFAEALRAFAELVGDGRPMNLRRREIELAADDRDILLAEWLNELVYLADAHRFVPSRLTAFGLERGGLRATVRGHVGEPKPLVKAASLHGLAYDRANEGWRARVVLDV
jgi:SHS2 domain-containing protein